MGLTWPVSGIEPLRFGRLLSDCPSQARVVMTVGRLAAVEEPGFSAACLRHAGQSGAGPAPGGHRRRPRARASDGDGATDGLGARCTGMVRCPTRSCAELAGSGRLFRHRLGQRGIRWRCWKRWRPACLRWGFSSPGIEDTVEDGRNGILSPRKTYPFWPADVPSGDGCGAAAAAGRRGQGDGRPAPTYAILAPSAGALRAVGGELRSRTRRRLGRAVVRAGEEGDHWATRGAGWETVVRPSRLLSWRAWATRYSTKLALRCR